MNDQPHLKRSLSLPLLVLYGLGTTIGAGIYALIGKVAGVAGLGAPLAFLVAAAMVGLTCFSFAELSSRYPKSAGEALYVREGLGLPALALITGLLVIASGIVSSGAIVIGAAGYLGTLVGQPEALLIALLVVLLGVIAAVGIAESVTLAAVLTVIEIGGLLLIVWQAAPAVALPPGGPGALLPGLEPAAWGGLLAGSILAFYAFIGFEDMVNVAEEVVEAPRRLPVAIIITLVVTTLLYVTVATVAVLALAPAELAASPAPLALLFERAGGDARIIAVIALMATVNGALIQIIMASRVIYGLGRQNALPRVLAKISGRTRTPILATALVTALVLAAALWFPIQVLAEATSAIVLAVFTLVNLALIRIKRRGPAPAGCWQVPDALPVVALVVSVAFLLLELGRLVLG